MQEHGRIGRDAFETAFGSWSAALDAAGVGDAPQVEHTRHELIDEILRVADIIGETPTRMEMRKHGEIATNCYYNRFGSWNDALQAAGFEPNEIHGYSREELLAEIDRLRDELGHTPTRNEMRSQGQFAEKPYRRVFGSWNAALKEAGLEPNQTKGRVRARYGIGWTDKKKRRIRLRDNRECWSCSLSQDTHKEEYGIKLDVHHIVPVRKFSLSDPRANSPQNLITLCRPCHKQWEWATDYSPPSEELPNYCNPPNPDERITLSDYADD